MTTSSDVIRQSELLHQLVIERNTLEELGRVEVLWMYPPAHRVLGFICKSGFLGSQKSAFQLKHIEAIGSNGLLMNARPDKTTADRVRQLESLIDHEVWSDEGNRVGKITDCLLNWKTGEITAYLLVSAGWASVIGEVYQLPPYQILSFGKRRVLVAEAAISQLEIYQPGIAQKITQTREFLKEEAAQEWATIAQRAEETTEQAREQWQQLAEQAKVRAQQLSQQVKSKTQGWFEQAKETSQNLAEQVKERSEVLGQQLEDRFETISTQADDWFDFDFDEEPGDRSNSSAKSPPQPSKMTEPPLVANPFPELDEEDEEDWFDFDFEPEALASAANRSTVTPPAPKPPIVPPTPPAATPSKDQDETEDDDVWI